jgi:hypothetical protein
MDYSLMNTISPTIDVVLMIWYNLSTVANVQEVG